MIEDKRKLRDELKELIKERNGHMEKGFGVNNISTKIISIVEKLFLED